MDESEHPRLAQLRSEGRRPVELVKLATVGATEQAWSKRHRPRELILRHLFKLAYLTARHIEKATDLIIAVAPPQERYFRNVLLFESLSGAPDAVREKSSLSVPLRLRLDEAEQRFESRYGPKSGSGNLFRFFVGRATRKRCCGLSRRGTGSAQRMCTIRLRSVVSCSGRKLTRQREEHW